MSAIYQEFLSTTGTRIHIEAVEDESGIQVIFWDEIKQNFGSVKRLLNGDKAVSLLRDKSNGNRTYLDPPRIKCYPNDVLTVVEDDTPPPSATSPVALPSPPQSSASLVPPAQPSPPQSETSLVSVAKTEDIIKDLSIADSAVIPASPARSRPRPTPGRGLVREASLAVIEDTRKTLVARQAEHDLLLQELKIASKAETQVILAKIEESKEALRTEIQKNLDLTQKIAKTAAERDEAEKQIRKVEQEFRDKLERMHDEAMASIRKLDNKMHALMNMTFELFEYQVPRLFIVLPDDLNSWTDWNPITDTFRLYFLCECGEHTKANAPNMPNHIHIARHAGYKIVRPSEFFQQYGSHLLTVLEMVRVGASIAGTVFPALSNLGILNGIEMIEDALSFNKEKFTPLLEKTINFTNSQFAAPTMGASAGESTTDSREGLEGADLRQLATFLEGADKSNTLANLYRMVTKDGGHVKWVCADHFNININAGNAERLKEVVHKYNGNVDEREGSINIRLTSADEASAFYGVLERATSFSKLSISFEWEVTWDDMVSFHDGIIKSGIVELRVSGEGLKKKPPLAFYNKNRFDPFIQLMSSGKLHSFTIDHCPSFLKRTNSFRNTGNSVRSLRLNDSWNAYKTRSNPDSIAKLVQCFPHLVDLQLYSIKDEDVKQALDLLSPTIVEHKSIRTLTFDGSVFEVVDGMISLIAATFPADLDRPLLGGCRLRRLTVENVPEGELIKLQNIVERNHALSEVIFHTTNFELFPHTALFQRLTKNVYRPIKVMFGKEGHVLATIMYNGTPIPTADQSTGQFCGTMDVQHWSFDGRSDLDYHPHLDQDFEILDRVTQQLPWSLKRLRLDLSSLTPVGLHNLSRVLSQTELDVLTIISSPLERKEEGKYDHIFEALNWSRLETLEIQGDFVRPWISIVEKGVKGWKKTQQQKQHARREPRWRTLSIVANGEEPSEIPYGRMRHLVSILKMLPPKELDLCNVKLLKDDWSVLLLAVQDIGLQRLGLGKSRDFDRDFVLKMAPASMSRSM
ncbi:hypothetical protein BGZ94_009462 [Podila epigama]|nr:hypothetical protein BGZ94_009462 [Podila epigama]